MASDESTPLPGVIPDSKNKPMQDATPKRRATLSLARSASTDEDTTDAIPSNFSISQRASVRYSQTTEFDSAGTSRGTGSFAQTKKSVIARRSSYSYRHRSMDSSFGAMGLFWVFCGIRKRLLLQSFGRWKLIAEVIGRVSVSEESSKKLMMEARFKAKAAEHKIRALESQIASIHSDKYHKEVVSLKAQKQVKSELSAALGRAEAAEAIVRQLEAQLMGDEPECDDSSGDSRMDRSDRTEKFSQSQSRSTGTRSDRRQKIIPPVSFTPSPDKSRCSEEDDLPPPPDDDDAVPDCSPPDSPPPSPDRNYQPTSNAVSCDGSVPSPEALESALAASVHAFTVRHGGLGDVSILIRCERGYEATKRLLRSAYRRMMCKRFYLWRLNTSRGVMVAGTGNEDEDDRRKYQLLKKQSTVYREQVKAHWAKTEAYMGKLKALVAEEKEKFDGLQQEYQKMNEELIALKTALDAKQATPVDEVKRPKSMGHLIPPSPTASPYIHRKTGSPSDTPPAAVAGGAPRPPPLALSPHLSRKSVGSSDSRPLSISGIPEVVPKIEMKSVGVQVDCDVSQVQGRMFRTEFDHSGPTEDVANKLIASHDKEFKGNETHLSTDTDRDKIIADVANTPSSDAAPVLYGHAVDVTNTTTVPLCQDPTENIHTASAPALFAYDVLEDGDELPEGVVYTILHEASVGSSDQEEDPAVDGSSDDVCADRVAREKTIVEHTCLHENFTQTPPENIPLSTGSNACDEIAVAGSNDTAAAAAAAEAMEYNLYALQQWELLYAESQQQLAAEVYQKEESWRAYEALRIELDAIKETREEECRLYAELEKALVPTAESSDSHMQSAESGMTIDVIGSYSMDPEDGEGSSRSTPQGGRRLSKRRLSLGSISRSDTYLIGNSHQLPSTARGVRKHALMSPILTSALYTGSPGGSDGSRPKKGIGFSSSLKRMFSNESDTISEVDASDEEEEFTVPTLPDIDIAAIDVTTRIPSNDGMPKSSGAVAIIENPAVEAAMTAKLKSSGKGAKKDKPSIGSVSSSAKQQTPYQPSIEAPEDQQMNDIWNHIQNADCESGGTNVRVAIRMRPLNGRELEMDSRVCVQMVDGAEVVVEDIDATQQHRFNFDFCFDANAEDSDPSAGSQLITFQRLGVEVLTNAWNGYNASLFAYGKLILFSALMLCTWI